MEPPDGNTYARIYAIVRTIPRGRVATYGGIARIAKCNGPRQVGYALHALGGDTGMPWHRVVSARGTITVGGASGITQRVRLEHEGVSFNVRGAIDLTVFGWRVQVRHRSKGRS